MNYHLSVPKVADFYKSWSGYEDELCWATAWIYRATNNTSYGRLAKYYYTSFNCGKTEESFDWDKKHAGVQLLMSQITGDEQEMVQIVLSCKINKHAQNIFVTK